MSEAGIRSRALGAWVLGLTAAAMAAAVVRALGHDAQPPGGDRLVLLIAAGAAFTAFVGAVIIAKTGNATGWLLGAGGAALAAGSWAAAIAASGCGAGGGAIAVLTRTPADSSGARAASVVGLGIWAACTITAVTFFPFGTLSPIRERGIGGRRLLAAPGLAWLGAAAIALAALTSAEDLGAFAYGARWCVGARGVALPAAAAAGTALLGAAFLAALVLAWLRYRAVSGSDRDQLRPVVVAASATAAAFVAAFAVPGARPFAGDQRLMVAAWCLGAIGMPVAVTLAVVRYRAFGVFRFVGFMADYRIWTVGMAVAALGVAGTVAALVARAAGFEDVPIAVAAAALLAGAAIAPFWWWAQARVDRRYGQHEADPAAVLEEIAERSRHRADDTALRGPAFDLLASLAPAVVVKGEGGMRFALPTADREVARHTFVHGSYDLATMRCAMEALAQSRGTSAERVLAGGGVLDVGANIGTSIVPLLRLFGADSGVAVEPAPANLEFLRLNLTLNELTDRVTVVPVALSDRDGDQALELAEGNWGDHRLRSSGAVLDDVEARRATIAVDVMRLDTLARSGDVRPQALTLAWLDVQGHEGQVLAGAGSLLSARVPVVSEFWPAALRRSGGLRTFTGLVATHFSRVVDLRHAQSEGRAVTLPAADVASLAERYAGPQDFTDLLLLP